MLILCWGDGERWRESHACRRHLERPSTVLGCRTEAAIFRKSTEKELVGILIGRDWDKLWEQDSSVKNQSSTQIYGLKWNKAWRMATPSPRALAWSLSEPPFSGHSWSWELGGDNPKLLESPLLHVGVRKSAEAKGRAEPGACLLMGKALVMLCIVCLLPALAGKEQHLVLLKKIN